MLVYTHPSCLQHDPGPDHPESPQRLQAVLDALEPLAFELLEPLEFQPLEPLELALCAPATLKLEDELRSSVELKLPSFELEPLADLVMVIVSTR